MPIASDSWIGYPSKMPEYLYLRVEPDLKAALKRAASDSERTISRVTIRILSEWLADAGYYRLPKDMKRIIEHEREKAG